MLLNQITFRVSNQREKDGRGMSHVWKTIEMHTEFWWRGIKEGNNLGKPRRRWDDNIEMELMCFYLAHSRYQQEKPTVCGLRLFCLHVATNIICFPSKTGDIFISCAISVFIL